MLHLPPMAAFQWANLSNIPLRDERSVNAILKRACLPHHPIEAFGKKGDVQRRLTEMADMFLVTYHAVGPDCATEEAFNGPFVGAEEYEDPFVTDSLTLEDDLMLDIDGGRKSKTRRRTYNRGPRRHWA